MVQGHPPVPRGLKPRGGLGSPQKQSQVRFPKCTNLPSTTAEQLTQQDAQAGTGAALGAVFSHKAVTLLERRKGPEEKVWVLPLPSLALLLLPQGLPPLPRPGSRCHCRCSHSGPREGSGHHCTRSPGGWHSLPCRGPHSPWGLPGWHRRLGRASCSSDRWYWPEMPRLRGQGHSQKVVGLGPPVGVGRM